MKWESAMLVSKEFKVVASIVSRSRLLPSVLRLLRSLRIAATLSRSSMVVASLSYQRLFLNSFKERGIPICERESLMELVMIERIES